LEREKKDEQREIQVKRNNLLNIIPIYPCPSTTNIKSKTSCSILPEMVRAIVLSIYISPRFNTSTNIVSIVSRHEEVASYKLKQSSLDILNVKFVHFLNSGTRKHINRVSA